MLGFPSILSLIRNEFNKFNNTRAQMLDSIYHMTLSRALTRILKTGVQDSHLAKNRSPTGKSESPTLKNMESHQFVHTVYLFHFSRK